MKTPLTELIEMIDGRLEFFLRLKSDSGKIINVLDRVKDKAQSLLPKEKEGIINAFESGMTESLPESAETYFNSTYQETVNENT